MTGRGLCAGCRWFDRMTQGEDRQPSQVGYCRAVAPGRGNATRFPIVGDDEWCGEWATPVDTPVNWHPDRPA